MDSKTIKISEENYRWLLAVASELQKKHNKLTSFDDALKEIKKCNEKKFKLSSLAGSLKISDEEAEEMKKSFRKGWGKWKIPSV